MVCVKKIISQNMIIGFVFFLNTVSDGPYCLEMLDSKFTGLSWKPFYNQFDFCSQDTILITGIRLEI